MDTLHQGADTKEVGAHGHITRWGPAQEAGAHGVRTGGAHGHRTTGGLTQKKQGHMESEHQEHMDTEHEGGWPKKSVL